MMGIVGVSNCLKNGKSFAVLVSGTQAFIQVRQVNGAILAGTLVQDHDMFSAWPNDGNYCRMICFMTFVPALYHVGSRCLVETRAYALVFMQCSPLVDLVKKRSSIRPWPVQCTSLHVAGSCLCCLPAGLSGSREP